MELKPGETCPLLKKPCIKLDCAWFTSIRGNNPETNDPVEHWGCSIVWIPSLLVENSYQQRVTSATVETFRNQMVSSSEKTAETFKNILQIASEKHTNNDVKTITMDDKNV